MITTDDKKKIYVTPLDHQIEMGGNNNDENIVSGHTRSPNGNKFRVNSNSTGLKNINQMKFNENSLRRILVKDDEILSNSTSNYLKVEPDSTRLYTNTNLLPDGINNFQRFSSFHHPLPYFDSYLSQEGNGNKIQLGYDKFLQSNIQKNNNYKFGIYERHRPPDPIIQVLLSHYGRYLTLNRFNGGLREYGFYSYSAGNDYHNNLPSGGYKVVEDYD